MIVKVIHINELLFMLYKMAFYVEFFKNIQSAQIVISTKNFDNNITTTQLVFSPTEISLVNNSMNNNDKQASTTTTIFCKWNDTIHIVPHLIPESLTNLKHIANEGIHARLRTRPLSSWQQDVRGIVSEVLLDNPLVDVGVVSMNCEFCQENLFTYKYEYMTLHIT